MVMIRGPRACLSNLSAEPVHIVDLDLDRALGGFTRAADDLIIWRTWQWVNPPICAENGSSKPNKDSIANNSTSEASIR